MKGGKGTLKGYKERRDFSQTPEPGGRPRNTRKKRFVVHEHRARRLHWDLRLEMGGVLRSWAVPKGPPKNPGIKRLAVQTEDHPVDYIDFEGVIPEGHYGAGTVEVWDAGGFKLVEEKKDRELKFTLNGKKLQGTYFLLKIRSGKIPGEKNWLFFKAKE
ncbi:MAG: DNA polymerase ligase N-terminal domain-containing protein [Candidatus Brocadiales bacterium]